VTIARAARRIRLPRRHAELRFIVSRKQRISEYTVERLLAATRDTQPAPGAGSAGAVALALAASCAGKAANITLKHHPEDESVRAAAQRFEQLSQEALSAGEEDAEAFEQYITEGHEAGRAPLVRASSHVESLIERLEQTIRAIESRIDPVMAGDFIAARALAQAARLIQIRNRSEIDAA